jgi:hypothetical protein
MITKQPYTRWLESLKGGDVVRVRNGAQRFRGRVTNSTPSFICVECLKFRRCDGWLSGHYKKRQLRLIQSPDAMR